jgi:uncharacterized protein
MQSAPVFSVPILDRHLVYAPLHQVVALVDDRARQALVAALTAPAAAPCAAIQPLLDAWHRPAVPPAPAAGPLVSPLFLGLITTRGCNMACQYCDFAAPKQASPTMRLELARAAIDGYLALLAAGKETRAEVHFFGGEPFAAAHIVDFAVAYAGRRAGDLGLKPRFEVTTNGLFGERRCHWVAEHFSAVVLSLDGPPDIQDRHRPGLLGHSASTVVNRNARILGQGSAELIVRCCVTESTVPLLPEITQWIGREFSPTTICLETLVPSSLSAAAGLASPDPWLFARSFVAAARQLEAMGIQAVLSTADVTRLQVSFCPVGKDALIVAPDGTIAACYLLPERWREQGLRMELGYVDETRRSLVIDVRAVERVRTLQVDRKSLCANCLCRYHCAGGCHVNHPSTGQPGAYTPSCIQTRLVTVATLLHEMHEDALADAWLASAHAARQVAWRIDDRLVA